MRKEKSKGKKSKGGPFTAVVDNLLYMNVSGTQWTMVTYFKKYKYKRENILAV